MGTLCGAAATSYWSYLIVHQQTTQPWWSLHILVCWFRGSCCRVVQAFSVLRHALYVDALDSLQETSRIMSIMSIDTQSQYTKIYASEAPSNQFQYLYTVVKEYSSHMMSPPLSYNIIVMCLLLGSTIKIYQESFLFTTVQDIDLFPARTLFSQITFAFRYIHSFTSCFVLWGLKFPKTVCSLLTTKEVRCTSQSWCTEDVSVVRLCRKNLRLFWLSTLAYLDVKHIYKPHTLIRNLNYM